MALVHIRKKVLSDGKASLILDYTVNGQRRKQTLKIYVDPKDQKSRDPLRRNAYDESYRQAELLRLEAQKRLINQDHDLPQAFDKRASFFDYFEKMAATRHHNWANVLKHLRAYTRGQLTFGNVTEEWISGFQDYLQGQEQMQNITVRKYVGIISVCLNHAVKHKVMPFNPGKNVTKVRVKESDPRYLTKEQVQQLQVQRDGIPNWLVRPFLFSCYTGLRLSDVESLTWVELKPNGKNAEGLAQFVLVKEQLKTDEIVRVPLSPQALAIVNSIKSECERSPRADDLVFVMKRRTAIKRYIRLWRKQAGFHFTYHSSRHTFGTGLQSAGVDINTTSKLMGHKSLGMTLRYARVISRQKEEAIDKMAAYWG
ncbi:site-specific integrase [Hymenobacter terrigena]